MLGSGAAMDILTLRAGEASVQLQPAAGGAITRYWQERGGVTWEWLRPPPPRHGAFRLAAAFPLVPYSNRIREGRFSFRGRSVVLPLNFPPERHSIHGEGWQAAWRPIAVAATEARLEYDHPAGAWPWTYRVTQHVALTAERLVVSLALTNESAEAMPAGLGWHPYFARTPRATVTARVRAMWLTDDEMLPTSLETSPAADLARGIAVERVALDNCCVGWSGRARLEWPEAGARLTKTAEPPLHCLVVFTPPRRPFFCVEPVSHVTDAFNLAAAGRRDTGMRILEAGETLRAAVTLRTEAGRGPVSRPAGDTRRPGRAAARRTPRRAT
jgi:aldose 1-epimerase